MISIFVMFSPDRMMQFLQQVECMQEMEGYSECQKTLLVDGHLPDTEVAGFTVHEVERPQGDFCWASMWEAGVSTAKNDVLLYLDSDRILPKDYLTMVNDRIDDGKFLFCESMFSFKQYQETPVVKEIRDLGVEYVREHYCEFKDKLDIDLRFQLPLHGWGKGPMSGNTAFTKATYEASGGVDPFYCGHGAYADTSFHHQCCDMGMVMEDIGVMELHLYHVKLINNGSELTRKDLEVLSMVNYIHYARSWKLNLRFARWISTNFNLHASFVDRMVEMDEQGVLGYFVREANKVGVDKAWEKYQKTSRQNIIAELI